MGIEVLTPAQKNAWEKVEAYKVKHPETTSHSAIQSLGLVVSTYQAAKKRMGFTGKVRKSKMITIIPEVHRPSTVVAFVGDADSVVQSVQKFMRGDA